VIKFRLNTRALSHTFFYVQPEDGFYEPKNVAVNKINKVLLDYILSLYSIINYENVFILLCHHFELGKILLAENLMFERITWWRRPDGFFFCTSSREKYKSPKILFITFMYLFICELEICCHCSVAVVVHVIAARSDVFDGSKVW
jgi:hypothetical protein